MNTNNYLITKKIFLDKNLYKDGYNTYFNAVEWRNVHMAGNIATFLEEQYSFHHYPYFRDLKFLWMLFWETFSLAKKNALNSQGKNYSTFELIFNQYMLMNIFVLLFSTLEYTLKGLFTAILNFILPKKNISDFQNSLATEYNE